MKKPDIEKIKAKASESAKKAKAYAVEKGKLAGAYASAKASEAYAKIKPSENPLKKGGRGELFWIFQYFYNLFLCFSQIINTLMGGDPDESFSSRVGKAVKRDCKFAIKYLAPMLDWLFWEKDHAVKSIELDEGGKEIWTWGKK